ncbi:hypothetical protein [Citrobacter portucalensis]|uniref:hypothetical protein n=1 Tax=Citrobacter portucalensis TaxID=1639133 RepID=UPI002243AFBC|nr:hypothetical protein [Citrobacter portucalensis]MCW8351456.1 hypothetical protein [Citrobacter portucalensis]MCX9050846.1 hypothetical protein [Citrobacter portucalensis]MCX9056852.1 hypothetical protein [Citrobacter portucalensis]
MKSFLPILLLLVASHSSATTFSIACHNQIATLGNGQTIEIKSASISSDENQSILKIDGTNTNLPPLGFDSMIHRTGAKYKDDSEMTVTAVDSPAPNAAALTVTLADANGNSRWYMLAVGCRTYKTR